MKTQSAMLSRVLAMVLLACSHEAWAARFSIASEGVSFEAPPGFTALSPAEIARKYPSSHPPSLVVGDVRRTTTIAYDLKPHGLPSEDLEIAKSQLEDAMVKLVPGIEWVDRRIHTVDGVQWIVLEMRSRAVDTDIHNIMLVTSLRGKMLLFNFNSTRQEFPAVESALRQSIRSVVVQR